MIYLHADDPFRTICTVDASAFTLKLAYTSLCFHFLARILWYQRVQKMIEKWLS